MPRTALTATATALGGITGKDIFAAEVTDNPDATNGNEIAFNSRMVIAVRNNHADDHITCTPQVHTVIPEGGDTLTVSDPAAIQIEPGTVVLIGPLSANFRSAGGKLELDWALEGGGTIAVTDVDVTTFTQA